MTRTSVAQLILAWLLVGVLLAGGFLVAVFRDPLAAAAGLSREGAPTAPPPSLFVPPPSPAQPAGDTGLAGVAETPAAGTAPGRAALDARIAGLDRTGLTGVAGAPVQLAWAAVDIVTGEVVASDGAHVPLIPASNTKTLTTVAVMNVFAGGERFATTVVQPEPGRVVLVGGGDPMLLSEPADPDAYPRPASTRELAAATAVALRAAGQSGVTVGYDATRFAEPGWNATWPASYRDQVTQLSALWVDEGRTGGARSRTPALDAASVFAKQLTEEGITVTMAPTPQPGTGAELARVESLPVHVLVETAMTRSNNSITEVLGLQLAIATGYPGTFAGSVAAIQDQLTALGLWDSGTVLRDASGLSRGNRATARMLAGAIRRIQTDPRLSVILDGLPTAGATGTLADRFTGDVSRPARGVARAKTGTLSLVATLAGTTLTADDRQIAFAAMVNGAPDGWAAKEWTDRVAGIITTCGC